MQLARSLRENELEMVILRCFGAFYEQKLKFEAAKDKMLSA